MTAVKPFLVHFLILLALSAVQLTFRWYLPASFYVNAFVLLLFVLGTVAFPKYRGLYAAVAVLPLSHSAVLMLDTDASFPRYVAMYGVFLTLGLAYTREHALVMQHVLHIPKLVRLIGSCMVGFGLGLLLFEASRSLPGLEGITPEISYLSLATLPFFVMAEELVFRRLIQNESEKLISPYLSVVFTTLVYSLYFLTISPLAMFVSYCFSLAAGHIYLKYKRISLTMLFNLCFKLGLIVGAFMLTAVG